jgi:hypothetical protein
MIERCWGTNHQAWRQCSVGNWPCSARALSAGVAAGRDHLSGSLASCGSQFAEASTA